MSNDSKSSLSSSLWGVAIAILGTVVAVWIAVKLIEQIWVALVVIAAVVVIVAAAIIAFRWWWQRRRW